MDSEYKVAQEKITGEIAKLEEERKKQQEDHKKAMVEINSVLQTQAATPPLSADPIAIVAAPPLMVSSDLLTKDVLANRLASDGSLAGISGEQAQALMTSVFALLNAQARAVGRVQKELEASQQKAARRIAWEQQQSKTTSGSAPPTVSKAAGTPPAGAMGEDGLREVSEDEEPPEGGKEEEMKIPESANNMESKKREERKTKGAGKGGQKGVKKVKA